MSKIFKLKNQVDTHLLKNDTLLRAVRDIAEAGRNEMEEEVHCHGEKMDAMLEPGIDRFCSILELLEIYRGRNVDFIESLFPGKVPGKAA